MPLERPLTGITVPLATPLLDSETLDPGGLERLVEHVVRGGVSAIFVLGTTGEGPCLSTRQRREVVERVCRDSTVPVLVGITDSSMEEALMLAEYSAVQGAAGLVYAGPTYSPISQPELIAHTSRFASAVTLPLFLYNMPSHTKVVFEPRTAGELSLNRNIHGLKDSSGNLMYFQAVRNAVPKNFGLLMGPEELMVPALLFGATGGVNGGANLFPELYVALYNAFVQGNHVLARELQDRVLCLSRSIYGLGTYSSSYLKGLKCALSLMGFGSGALVEPYQGFDAAERDRIASALAQFADAQLHSQ
jgi:dihydrodipicolinate synthase/N-acetylneuraminate lyase